MARRGVSDKDKVLILQRILSVKGLLFGENHSTEDKNEEWKRIAKYASDDLRIRGRDYKYFKNSFWYGCKTSLSVSKK